MLALTRRIGEEVVIGDPRNPLGVIRIMEIHGDKVRLSFDFPKDTPINRRELAEQKARQLTSSTPAPGTASGAAPGTSSPGSTPPRGRQAGEGVKDASRDAQADDSPDTGRSQGYSNPRQQTDRTDDDA